MLKCNSMLSDLAGRPDDKLEGDVSWHLLHALCSWEQFMYEGCPQPDHSPWIDCGSSCCVPGSTSAFNGSWIMPEPDVYHALFSATASCTPVRESCAQTHG